MCAVLRCNWEIRNLRKLAKNMLINSTLKENCMLNDCMLFIFCCLLETNQKKSHYFHEITSSL